MMDVDLADRLLAGAPALTEATSDARTALLVPAAAEAGGLFTNSPSEWQVLRGRDGTLGLQVDVRAGRTVRESLITTWRLTVVDGESRIDHGTDSAPELRHRVAYLAEQLRARVETPDGQALLARLAAAQEAGGLADDLAAYQEAAHALVAQYALGRAAQLRRQGAHADAATFEVLGPSWTGSLAELETAAAVLRGR